MIEFIEVKDFAFFYYNLLLIFVLILFVDSNQMRIDDEVNIRKKNTAGKLLLWLIIFYIGLRPITYNYFGDMGMYNHYFERYAAGDPLNWRKDKGFELFMYLCSKVMTAQMFFLACAFFYIYPLYVATRKLFKEYWYYAFIALLVSFSFWGYGTNGIRNGLATSIFLFAISREKKAHLFALITLSVLFHRSMIIPAVAYLLTTYYKNTRHYFYFWLLAIPLSIGLGGFWENFFLNFGFGEEERLQGYFSDIGKFDEEFSATGFRWDFVLYSASGVFAGWYFIIKRKYEDALYMQLFNIYLVVNAFWILVIRANYSNRFAYLSWFMLAFVIVYPMLKLQFFSKQHQLIGKIIVIYFAFTYLLNVILATKYE